MDKPTWVMVSGGRTSAYMAWLLKNEPNHFFAFQNTGIEQKATYEFLHKMETEWNLPIVWLEYSCPDPAKKATFKVVDYHTAHRGPKIFTELMNKRKAVPNKFKRFCTAEMKTKTARRYIRSTGCKSWFYALGYRADEDRKTHDNIKMQTSITPLKDMGVTAQDVMEFWKSHPFDLQLPFLPNGKTFGGNCMGCFWHSEYQHAHLSQTNPEHYAWLEKVEQQRGYTFNENYSFKELRERVEAIGWENLDQTDALCSETNGSCGV